MSSVETNQADQTPVDSHAEDGETGAVCPKTTSPTDIQEREAIARIIDPGKWRVLDTELERVKRHHPNGGYDPDNFKDRASLTKADDILALRSNPQPGSAGITDVSEVLITPEALQGLLGSAFEAGCQAVHDNYQPDPDPSFSEAAWDYVASLDFTETTRQPGEVERLRAYAASCERTTQDMIATTAKHFAEVERLRSELKQAQLERDDALDRVDELEKDAEIVSVEFEKDCWVAMRSLLQQVGWDDFSEGVTADMAREIVSDEIKRLTALTPSESQEAGNV